MLDIQILHPDDTAPLSDLQLQWQSLCSEINLTNQAETLFADLQKHYTKSSRMYHNFSHIHTMLRICEMYKAEAENYKILQLVVWYHDIIYRATRKDNEVKSAEYALAALAESSLSSLELDQLKQLIISTKSHDTLLDNFDNRLLLDIDLGILAASRETYTSYTQAIRKEYKIFPVSLYKKGRKKVLKHFLEKKWIYFTPEFQEKHEVNARENLAWEMEGFAK